jgi:hypothetical protein
MWRYSRSPTLRVSGIGADDIGPHLDPQVGVTAGRVGRPGAPYTVRTAELVAGQEVCVGARTPAEEVDPSAATTKVEFGVCLRALRSAAGLSLRELAAASRTSNSSSLVLHRSTIEEAELGRRLPRPDWLEVYLAACRGARRPPAGVEAGSSCTRQPDRQGW